MIAHRPPEDLLLAYAAGTLAEPMALVIASHAAMCPEVAAQIRTLERIGGTLLQDIAPVPLEPGALDRALALLDRAIPDPPAPPVTAETRALLPAPLWPYVNGDIGNLAWRRRNAHIETAHLAGTSGRCSAFLLRAEGGCPVPRHTHGGLELTLVLAGSYCDVANCYGRGDIQIADPTTHHGPVAQPGEDCICLIALEAPIRFTSPIGRLANRFVKL